MTTSTTRIRSDLDRPPGPGGRGRLLLVLGLLVLVVAVLATAVVLGSATSRGGPAQVNVVVVPDSAPGEVTLESIAAATLGDPGRSSEIFALNRGLEQPGGGRLDQPDDPLRPGWVLRLPDDASGPGVRRATDDRGPAVGSGSGGITVSLAVVVAAAASILLAVVTAVIVGRLGAARGWRTVQRGWAVLAGPWRRRRRRHQRLDIGRRFAAAPDLARRVAQDLAAGPDPVAVHAVRVDEQGLTVWVAPTAELVAPWTRVDATRWHRPHARSAAPAAVRSGGDPTACLVRVGVDETDATVLVDLSHLDGALSVSGDRAAARDVLHTLIGEVSRARPDLPVVALPGADVGQGFARRAGDRELWRPAALAPPVSSASVGPGSSVHGTVWRRPVRGLVLVPSGPTGGGHGPSSVWCGSRGAGWTGLAHGHLDDSHWHWTVRADGSLTLPTLGLELTVPVNA